MSTAAPLAPTTGPTITFPRIHAGHPDTVWLAAHTHAAYSISNIVALVCVIVFCLIAAFFLGLFGDEGVGANRALGASFVLFAGLAAFGVYHEVTKSPAPPSQTTTKSFFGSPNSDEQGGVFASRDLAVAYAKTVESDRATAIKRAWRSDDQMGCWSLCNGEPSAPSGGGPEYADDLNTGVNQALAAHYGLKPLTPGAAPQMVQEAANLSDATTGAPTYTTASGATLTCAVNMAAPTTNAANEVTGQRIINVPCLDQNNHLILPSAH